MVKLTAKFSFMELKKIHISDIGKVVTGKTPRTSIVENYGGDIPFLTPSDDLSYKSVPKTGKTLTEQGLNEVKNCLLPPHSVCVSCIGTDLGKVVMTSEPTITNQQFNSIIPNRRFDADFVYYLMTLVGKELNYLSKTSTAVPIINKSSFSNYEVEVPDLETQEKIASILSSLDSKIELNRRINDNLEQQAQALFKSWFVDFEPFRGGEFVDSELGLIPKGWRVVSLGEVTKQITEKVGNREDVTVLSPINSGELVLSEEYFTKQVFSKDLSKYLIVNPLSFAYNPARINIGSIGLNTFDFVGCVSPVYVVFECEPNYQYFFDFFKRTAMFKDEVALRAIGGVRQSLGYNDLSLIKIIYPTSDVVVEFNNLYLKMKEVMIKNTDQNEKFISLRDSLLPKLMSGELKINEFNC
ncbi:restriction endonuclease subunit S [Bacteroides xylanisolvens]|uniref:restriction endonuclease subunit S n=3 Tax=Bacteroides TaxID=816 RepID=UPI0023076B15|nr:restriction endonuclease subunit S [Bacteroides xylanisolvens]MDB0687767.1 restriction endonuclease subunit S [Bacteroides xylanisolvens]MDB0701038.1 restriction endonuclease subunit S [Bacteroides xylanisolvens]